ncbi:MAG TPA: thiol reductase thioredoxin [Syntrophomonas sp.]|jgi:thioredoxin 1|nr:thiol reductase thioredoxin [Syntrophomonas sp.]HCF71815.1 thiol reductase thioredoxin [Syntrophomonas sp.]
MLAVDKQNFEDEVLKAQGLVIVDFWGTTCEPCKALLPFVETLAEKYADKAKFCKLNVNENRRLAIGQKVLGLPTIGFYRDGVKIREVTGDVTPEKIEEELKRLI